MAKWAVLFAAAVVLAKPGMAQAASPDGDHIPGGNSVNPGTVAFQNLLSDVPGTPPRKIQGTVTQTPASLNLP